MRVLVSDRASADARYFSNLYGFQGDIRVFWVNIARFTQGYVQTFLRSLGGHFDRNGHIYTELMRHLMEPI